MFHLDHVSYVALRSGVVRLVLLAHQNDEVQVVPDVVLQFDVLFEWHRLVVKLVSLQTCNNTQNWCQTFCGKCLKTCRHRTCLLFADWTVSYLFPPTADETRGLQYLLFLLFLTPQVSKRVDDDAEDQVEDDDDDDEVEQQVIHHPGRKQRLLHTHTNVFKVYFT